MHCSLNFPCQTVADHTRQGYCLRLSSDISLGWITLCFSSGFSSPASVVRESPWFSERELGPQAGCWQRVGGVFESHVPLEQRLCVRLSSLAAVLICSVASRRASANPLCGHRRWGPGEGRDGGSGCRCRVGEKSDCRLRLQALWWVFFFPFLIPTFLLS